MSAPPLATVHVERTDDPTVLRWVCHDPRLAMAPGGARSLRSASPLGALLADHVVEQVAVVGGDLLVRVADPGTWSVVAAQVQSAVTSLDDADVDEIVSAPVVDTQLGSASVDELQAIVDRSAGPVAAAHGGRLEVVGVDGDVVTVRLHGACHGCAGVPQTLGITVANAVRRSHPELRVAVE